MSIKLARIRRVGSGPMLACLVCSTRNTDDDVGGDGPLGIDEAKSVVVVTTNTERHQQQLQQQRRGSSSGISIRPFTFQLKQMASRITAGALYRTCRPGCIQVNKHDGNDPVVHPSTDDAPEPEAQAPYHEPSSPDFSLKSYKIDPSDHGHDQVRRVRGSTPDNNTSPVSVDLNRFPVKSKRASSHRGRSRNDLSEAGASPYASPSPVVVKGVDSEWVAQVEPGVYITFHLSPDGFNDLKRIKFRRSMYSKEQAERWWSKNCNMVREVYNVRPPSAAPPDDDRMSSGYATPEPYSNNDISKKNTANEHDSKKWHILESRRDFAIETEQAMCITQI
ncbi:hypothetical protein R1flu_020982 [Riccia fluitans]|uniref:BRX domain-containing protein n=1 Tax=Riccia fluitans TaxID=41844 RepID=A0ABD1ZRH9_9MARC